MKKTEHEEMIEDIKKAEHERLAAKREMLVQSKLIAQTSIVQCDGGIGIIDELLAEMDAEEKPKEE